jgi:hypothetical protein
MSLFGSKKDFGLLTKMNRELLQDIIEQEIAFYKLSINETHANIYGESSEKTFYDPIVMQCIITRGDQVFTTDDFGPDVTRELNFAFLRDDFVDLGLVPEVGDIIMLSENYYEIDSIVENEYFFGKDPDYNYARSDKYGKSISIRCSTHLTRADKLGITRTRF